MNNKLVYAGAAVVVIIIAAYLVLGGASAAPTGSGQVAFRITDPAQVPAGTSALVIAYSNVQAQVSNAGSSSGWIRSNASGSVNLMAVVNLSQTIATLSIPANATIQMVRFNVTSAKITINGTVYNVTVPSGKVTAHITGRSRVNGSSSVLLDLSPTVATVVTSNSTIFVMVPSLKAVIVPNTSTSATLRVGAQARLDSDDQEELREARANISIQSASITVSNGNVTHIRIAVKDNSNSSVKIGHAGVFGNETVQLNLTDVDMEASRIANTMASNAMAMGFCANAGASQSASGSAGSNGSTGGMLMGGASGSGSFSSFGVASSSAFGSFLWTNFANRASIGTMVRINGSICTANGVSLVRTELDHAILNFSTMVRVQQSRFRMLGFRVAANGTLMVPSGEDQFEGNESWLTIQPGQTATLSFDGRIAVARAHMMITPIVGQRYRVAVGGGLSSDDGEGALAFANATAQAG